MNGFLISFYTTRIFFGISISVAPLVLFSLYVHQISALYILLASCIPVLLIDGLFNREHIFSGYSVLAGFLIYLIMPYNIPIIIPILASTFVSALVLIYKDMGLPFNAIALSLCFVYILFYPDFSYDTSKIDGVSTKAQESQMILYKIMFQSQDEVDIANTPLGMLFTNKINNNLKYIGLNIPEGYIDIFLFSKSRILGECSIPLILVSFVIFYSIGYTRWFSVFFYFLGFVIPVYIFGGQTLFSGDIFLQIFSGSFLIGMFFIYNDINTTPISTVGAIVCSLLAGFLVFCFRKYSTFLDGMPFAIALMDLIRPLVDNMIFGIKRNMF